MSLKAIGISRASLGDLVERYQHRILTLELDLRQMGREESISSSQYKKRVLLMKQLRLHLQLLEQRVEEKEQGIQGGDTLTGIPTCASRSPEETLVCLRYFAECLNMAKTLVGDCEGVVNLMRTTLRGRRFQFMTLLDLSRLRRRLLLLNQKIQSFENVKPEWSKYIGEVLKIIKTPSSYRIELPRLKILKNSYFELEKVNQEIIALSLQCEKEEDEQALKENWLSFQEWKVSQLGPTTVSTFKEE
ncbi:MAG: hypothetical protein AB8G05_20590 [Oligoflexales bacterium]